MSPSASLAGSDDSETVRELLLDIEHTAKWANQPNPPEAMYVRARLAELAVRARLALAAPTLPGEPCSAPDCLSSDPKCEGCDSPATTMDSEGVDLCGPCAYDSDAIS